MRISMFHSCQTTLVIIIGAVLFVNELSATASAASDTAEAGGTCAKNERLLETNQDDFEAPRVGWCRRRPTWRAGKDDSGLENETIRYKCQKVLDYTLDLDELAGDKYPQLSSTYDIQEAKLSRETVDGDDDIFYDTGEEEEEDDEAYYKLPVLERPLLKEIQYCVDEILPPTNQDAIKKPSVARLYFREDGLVVMAIVEDALSEQEAESVLALAKCCQKFAPKVFEHRSFEGTGGGNDVTYMAGFLQLVTPGVAYSIQQAAKLVWEASGWDQDERTFPPVDTKYDRDGNPHSVYTDKWWPNPVSECGIRTTEHLSYDQWKGLGFHEDSGSEYTILVALSDPSDYEGGAFSLCPEYDNNDGNHIDGGHSCPNKISVKPKKRSAVVFLSEFSHGVEEIKSPGRVTFANELWRYGDLPAFEMRLTPEQYIFGYDNGESDY